MILSSARADEFPLDLDLVKSTEGLEVRIDHRSDEVVSRLEFSDDLVDWNLLGANANSSWRLKVPDHREKKRFYRAAAGSNPGVEKDEDWYGEITGFRNTFTYGGFLKFTVLLDDPTRIYFQDGRAYPFHYQFAREFLPPFLGVGFQEFNAATLFPGPNQKAITGAVIDPAGLNGLGVQILGEGGYPPETIRFLFDLLSSNLDFDSEWFSQSPEMVLLPTQTQLERTFAEQEELEALGILVGSNLNAPSTRVSYVSGWALGRLRYIPAASLEEAFLSGDLKSTDILLTDSLPPEIPFVEGIFTLAPATPNSHVFILAQAQGIPAGYVNEAHREEVWKALDGREVIVKVDDNLNRVDVYPASEVRVEVLTFLQAEKQRTQPALVPIVKEGPVSGPVSIRIGEGEAPGVDRIGGKAANFEKLVSIVPENAPTPAMAFSFSLWDRFMSQPVADGGGSLEEVIASRLAPFEENADVGQLHEALIEVREWILDGTFDDPTREEVIKALSGFDPEKRIRFRSSTNLEDTEGFVGAGLYDSFSGCLADDTDADSEGPSGCDPEREKERGVFRAIRKVFASFYNLNAYLQRRRFDVDEREVGMAILVHHSFPDEDEAANGVATAEWVMIHDGDGGFE